MFARLFVAIVSWNRPHFLKETLDSLFDQLTGIEAYVMVIDNGSGIATRQVIAEESRIDARLLLNENIGINGALELGLPLDLERRAPFVLFSDADMRYNVPIANLLDVFDADPKIGAVSLQDSPEHPVHATFRYQNERWSLKFSERGCAFMMRTERFQELRPLPVHQYRDFDWWVVRDAMHSLRERGEQIAVRPGAASHLGWRAGDSTWQPGEIPEVWNQLDRPPECEPKEEVIKEP